MYVYSVYSACIVHVCIYIIVYIYTYICIHNIATHHELHHNVEVEMHASSALSAAFCFSSNACTIWVEDRVWKYSAYLCMAPYPHHSASAHFDTVDTLCWHIVLTHASCSWHVRDMFVLAWSWRESSSLWSLSCRNWSSMTAWRDESVCCGAGSKELTVSTATFLAVLNLFLVLQKHRSSQTELVQNCKLGMFFLHCLPSHLWVAESRQSAEESIRKDGKRWQVRGNRWKSTNA